MLRRLSPALLIALGAAHLGTAWAGPGPTLLLVATALVGYGVVGLTKLPAWLTAPLVILGVAFGLGSFIGLPAIVGAVPRLLSLPYPAPGSLALVAPGVLLVVVVAVACAARVARPGLPGRSGREAGAAFAPLVAIAVLYLGATVLSGGRADRYGLIGGALLAAAVAGWLADAPKPETQGASTRGAATRAVPALALIAAVVVLTATLPVGRAFDPRRLVGQPAGTLAQPDPLAQVTTWARAGDAVLLKVRAERPVPLRLAVLDTVTGNGWRASGRYFPLGIDVSGTPDAALPGGRRQATVDLEMTLVAGLNGRWLPTPGTPEATSLTDALGQPAGGTLARLDPSPVGLRYRVRAEIDAADPARLAQAGVPDGPTVARYLALPSTSSGLAERARQTIAGARSPFEQATRLEAAVRTDPALDATDFGVLARAVGLPTRLVVGFLPAQTDPDGQWLVRGRDALTWPEVYFTEIGWVAFDPR